MKKRVLRSAYILFTVPLAFCSSAPTTTSTEPIILSQTQTMQGSAGTIPETPYHALFTELNNTRKFDLLALARSNDHFTTFVQLLEQANMTAALTSGGPTTVFLPVNDAFNALTPEQFALLIAPENKAELTKILQAHIVPDKIYTSDLKHQKRLKSSGGADLPVLVNENQIVTIGGAQIVKPDVEVSNGVLHVISTVLKLPGNKEG
ncbi:fasciclin domain-containing protein [Pontibacter burrus]|uniref:Fasciclin domain-containing protein n=1 Tax=Pontibacter burrus TaxID=2704466 RepID=A0A6B3M0A1_9BACT|nr:fasciclin domain-containing protein [Pontibacter burrus]NEM99350.1 fasciclin domain-containing protein [Pontibacter burrus]